MHYSVKKVNGQYVRRPSMVTTDVVVSSFLLTFVAVVFFTFISAPPDAPRRSPITSTIEEFLWTASFVMSLAAFSLIITTINRHTFRGLRIFSRIMYRSFRRRARRWLGGKYRFETPLIEEKDKLVERQAHNAVRIGTFFVLATVLYHLLSIFDKVQSTTKLKELFLTGSSVVILAAMITCATVIVLYFTEIIVNIQNRQYEEAEALVSASAEAHERSMTEERVMTKSNEGNTAAKTTQTERRALSENDILNPHFSPDRFPDDVREILLKLETASKEEINQSLIDAGVYTLDGRLRKKYGGDAD